MANPYRFGIVGAGMIGGFHAQAIQSLPNARLTAVCDTFPGAAEQFGQKCGCVGIDDLERFLSRDDLDIVTIATPSGTHSEIAVAAALHGKHCIVEKPLDVTLARIDAAIEAHERAGTRLGGVFNFRYLPTARLFKQAVEQGRFGKLTFGMAYGPWWRDQAYYDNGGWRGTWKLDGGGALMNQAIHSVDLLTYFMGPVEEIRAQSATLAHERIAVEDACVATLRFANGALGVIEASTATYPGYLKRIEIHGSEGTAIMEEEDITRWDFAKKKKRDDDIHEQMANRKSTGGGASDPTAIGHHGHAHQFKDMIEAIKKNREPAVNGPEGRRSVEIILGTYKAAETGKPVKLPLASDPVLKARSRDAEAKQGKGK